MNESSLRTTTMDYRHLHHRLNRLGPLPYFVVVCYLTAALLLAVHCSEEASSSERLHFISEPDSVLAAADGRRVTYKCAVSPSSATIKWLLNGTIIANNSYEQVRLTSNKLIIKLQKQSPMLDAGKTTTPVTDFQGAIFQCLAQWNNLTIVSQPAKLIIAELYPFEQFQSQQVLTIVNNTAVISCNLPKSIPFAVTEYEYNNTTINYNHGRYRLLPSGNLQILEAKASDSGIYRCVAHNPFLQEKVSANYHVNLRVLKARHPLSLHIRNLHFVVRPKENINAVIGSNITLECVVNGFPTPKITWKRVNGDLSKKRTYVEGGNLLIITLSKEDEGTYVCTANNGKTIISSAVVLEVNETPQIPEEKLYEIIDVTEGQEFNLDCTAMGHPKPIISWIHNGYYIDTMATNDNERNGLSFHDNSTILRIRHADPKLHAGIFQCFASNELGTTHSIKRINFRTESMMDNDMQMMTTKNNGYHQQENHPQHSYHHHHHHKHHHSNRNDFPKTTTGHNNEQPDGNNIGGEPHHDALGEEEFDLPHPNGEEERQEEHQGNYEENLKKRKHPKAHQHHHHHHHKDQKMIPPTRPEVSKLSDDSVMVRWNVSNTSGSMGILFFKVQYKEKGKQDWRTIDADIPPHILSYEVSDLKLDTVYRFRIAAVYANDDNKNSQSSARFVLHRDSSSDGLMSTPTIRNAIPLGPTEITVDWKYLNLDSTSIDGFLLYYRPADTVGEYTKVAVNGMSTTQYNLSHLQPNTPYEIKIRAFNSAGTSDFSNIYTVKTLPVTNDIDIGDKKVALGDEKKFDEDRASGGSNRIEPNIFTSTLNLNNKTQWVAICIATAVLILVFIVCLLICIVRIRNPSPNVLKKAKPPTTASDYFFNNNGNANNLNNSNSSATSNGNIFDRRANGQIACKVNGNGNLPNGNGAVAHSNNSPRSACTENELEAPPAPATSYANGRAGNNKSHHNGSIAKHNNNNNAAIELMLTSTLNRRGNGTLRSPMSYSSHHLYNSTANRLNEANHHDGQQTHGTNNATNTATIDRKRMMKSVLDPYQDYHHHQQQQQQQQQHRMQPFHNSHSTSFTRLNGTLERKRRSRTDLNTLDRPYHPRNGTLERHSNYNLPPQSNGHIVIMQSSC